jgi:hypothetical protein
MVYKYSKIISCANGIAPGTTFMGEFMGDDAVGPFNSYQMADTARAAEIKIATDANKEIKLTSASCS